MIDEKAGPSSKVEAEAATKRHRLGCGSGGGHGTGQLPRELQVKALDFAASWIHLTRCSYSQGSKSFVALRQGPIPVRGPFFFSHMGPRALYRVTPNW